MRVAWFGRSELEHPACAGAGETGLVCGAIDDHQLEAAAERVDEVFVGMLRVSRVVHPLPGPPCPGVTPEGGVKMLAARVDEQPDCSIGRADEVLDDPAGRR